MEERAARGALYCTHTPYLTLTHVGAHIAQMQAAERPPPLQSLHCAPPLPAGACPVPTAFEGRHALLPREETLALNYSQRQIQWTWSLKALQPPDLSGDFDVHFIHY